MRDHDRASPINIIARIEFYIAGGELILSDTWWLYIPTYTYIDHIGEFFSIEQLIF